MTPIASIVIPAHNEAAVIERCLNELLRDAVAGEFEVVVAANGCTDDTVQCASSYPSSDVRVVETSTASKIAALNLGDRSAVTLPRIYLDADVTISTAAARALADVLDRAADVTAAAPRLCVDSTASSRPARMYLRIWQGLPVFDQGYVGSGCYALSAAGRQAFGEFPDVTNDDQWVNSQFAATQKLTLTDHHLVISAPRTLRGIVRRSVRVSAGARAQRATAASSAMSTRAYVRGRFAGGDATAAAVFLATQVAVKLLARVRALRGKEREWLRDETSRTPLTPTLERPAAPGGRSGQQP